MASNSDAPRHSALVRRFQVELADLDAIAQRAVDTWPGAQPGSPAQRVYLESVALNVEGSYSGVERLLEQVAKDVDGIVPRGDNWHRDLLNQMTQELPNIRPAVFGAALAPAMDELRRFRHVAHHQSVSNLDPARMAPLVEALPELWRELRADLMAFAAFLEDLDRRHAQSPRK